MVRMQASPPQEPCTTPEAAPLIHALEADGRLPVAQRRGYRHIFDAVSQIARQEALPSLPNPHFEPDRCPYLEGMFALWRSGLLPNMNRPSP